MSRLKNAFVVLFVVFALAGCATPQPGQAPSSIAQPEPTESTSQPSLPEGTPTSSPGVGMMSEYEAVALCKELAAKESTMRDAVLVAAEPWVELRELSPEWLVILSAERESTEFAWLCVLGGDPGQPSIATYGQFAWDGLTEERIERIRTEPENSPGWGANN